MWTNGPYAIDPAQELKISVRLKAVAPGSSKIGFRVTTMDMYEIAPDIEVLVK